MTLRIDPIRIILHMEQRNSMTFRQNSNNLSGSTVVRSILELFILKFYLLRPNNCKILGNVVLSYLK